MTNKQEIQELIERVDVVIEFYDGHDKLYPLLSKCKSALQEYQKVMDRVEDEEILAEKVIKPAYEDYINKSDYDTFRGIAKAIQQYIRGDNGEKD